jgi:hypothetical protein
VWLHGRKNPPKLQDCKKWSSIRTWWTFSQSNINQYNGKLPTTTCMFRGNVSQSVKPSFVSETIGPNFSRQVVVISGICVHFSLSTVGISRRRAQPCPKNTQQKNVKVLWFFNVTHLKVGKEAWENGDCLFVCEHLNECSSGSRTPFHSQAIFNFQQVLREHLIVCRPPYSLSPRTDQMSHKVDLWV